MRDVLQVSYTGDLLAHRRCPRSWCYEKYAGFHPYEQAQALEGRLIHHAMEWLARFFAQNDRHATVDELRARINTYFSVLRAKGLRTAFETKRVVVDRVQENLFPLGEMHPFVRVAVEGSAHTEYELRTVRALIPGAFAGKSKLMLTGILDLVMRQEGIITYPRSWAWTDRDALGGEVVVRDTISQPGDVEIWDYKGTRSNSPYVSDYVLQLLTYARLYSEKAGELPTRCVLFFVNEQNSEEQLVAIDIEADILERAEQWTVEQARLLRQTALQFESDPLSVLGGRLDLQDLPPSERIDPILKQQCYACGSRFDCSVYAEHLGDPNHVDIRLDNVHKN